MTPDQSELAVAKAHQRSNIESDPTHEQMSNAIRFLSAAKKDRTSDNLKNVIKIEFAYGRIPEIPDFALDKHTEKGRALGRDSKHFLAEGSRVENELPVDQNYKSRLLDLLDKIEQEGSDMVENAFAYNGWQA